MALTYYTISKIPTSWGISINDESLNIVSNFDAPNSYKFNIMQNGTISLGGKRFTKYEVFYGNMVIGDLPPLYINKNKNVFNAPSFIPIHTDKEGKKIYPQYECRGYCILSNNYLYYVYEEVDYIETTLEILEQTNPNKTSFQPYEPIVLTGLSLEYTLTSTAYNSASLNGTEIIENVVCNSWEEVKEKCSSYTVKEKYTEEDAGANTLSATISGTTIEWEITVEDFEEDYYVCRRNNNTNFKIYVGQEVNADFLNSFNITRIQKNNYKEIATIINDTLDKNKMSNVVLSSLDVTFDFNYEINDQISIGVSIDENLHYLSEDKKFSNVLYTSEYKIGETINAGFINVKEKGSLTYDDGTTIHLSQIEYLEDPYAEFSLGSGYITINDETEEEFSLSYILPTKHFGTLECEFVCQKVDSNDFISYVRLIDAKTNFKYNEVIDFGENAGLECYNSYGDLIKTIYYESFNSVITKYDINYGSFASKLIDRNIDSLTLSFEIGDVIFKQEITFSYAKSFKIKTDKVKQFYYIDSSVTEFDYSGLIGSILYSDNKIIDVSESITFTHDNINYDIDSKSYTIIASVNYEGRILTQTFKIDCEKLRPIAIYTSGEQEYYNNNLDNFDTPSFTFTLEFNDKHTEEINTDMVNFYRDSKLSSLLSVNSIIKESDGSKIYFSYKEADLSNYYQISFKEDRISSVELTNNVSFVLGNKYNDFRDNFIIKVSYESGFNINENYKDYTFKNEDYILAEENVIILVNGNEYTLDQSKITFNIPEIKNINIMLNGLPLSYNNNSDKINVSKVALKISYKNATFENIISIYNKEDVISNNQYTIICDDLVDYNFIGAEEINVDMEGEASKEITLNFKVLNYFNLEESKTYQLKMNILEITDITGISIIDTYTDYKIGESFLNENDDTKINIYYKDTQGTQRKIETYLRDGLPAINITPLRNTVFYKTDKAKTIRISSATNSNVSVEYTISVSANYDYSTLKTRNLRVIKINPFKVPTQYYDFFIKEFINDVYIIVDDENTIVINGTRRLKDNLSDYKIYGYLKDINDSSKQAGVVFFEDYIPPVDGESNITIKYPCYVRGNADYINKCHFGHLFGNNNAKNRLFLSGNPDLPNCDWHSGGVDFTYFEDTSYCFYGQTDNKVIGYDIVSNDKMVVLKSKSDKEPTIYYRTNGLIQAIDSAGNAQIGLNNKTLYEESYPLVVGNIGAGALSNKSIINFNGDTLFMSSDKQIDGLDVVGIIGDSQRYAYTRSYYINPLLRKLDLSNAQFFTNNKYLFVIFPDYLLVTHFEKFDTDSKQYDWWKLDIKNVVSMIEINDEIYYGTNDGRFFKLENNIFQDITKIFVGVGGSELASEGVKDNQVIVSDRIIKQLYYDNEYYFKIIPSVSDESSYMYYQVATLNNVKTGNVDLYIDVKNNWVEIVGLTKSQVDYEKITSLQNTIKENTIYYLNAIECDSLSPINKYYKKYKLKVVQDVPFGRGECFKLIEAETGNEMDVSKLYRATLCERLDKEYLIGNIDFDNSTFKLFEKGKEINLVRYANQNISNYFKAEIKRYENVKAYYITAPYTMGNLMYDKTIWGWTLTNDTDIPSSLEVCQATNNVDFEEMTKLADIVKTDYGYSFNNIKFTNIDFDRYVIPHKYTFYRPIKVPFICFGFRNNNGENAVLSTMQVVYTVPLGSVGKG